MNRIFRYTIFYLLIFLVIIGIFGTFNGGKSPTKEITYPEFLEALDKNEITEAKIQPDKSVYIVEGSMKGYEKGDSFTVNLPRENQSLMDRIDAAAKDKNSNIEFLKAPETSGWVQFFTGIIPFIIIIFLFFFLMSQSQGGGNKVMSFGKSKAKLYDDQKKKSSFYRCSGCR